MMHLPTSICRSENQKIICVPILTCGDGRVVFLFFFFFFFLLRKEVRKAVRTQDGAFTLSVCRSEGLV